MVRKRLQEYIDICLAFRIVTLVFSTIFYIGMSVYQGDDTSYRWVALGMFASCLLSSWLYKNIGDRDPWLRIMFAIEVFSYGMFAVVSGGFSSPYLWYQMNCILLMVTLEVYETFSLFAVTNPEKIVMELLQLLNRTIAPNGCMLVKFDKLFRTQKMEYIGLEDEVVQELLKEIEEENLSSVKNCAECELDFYVKGSHYRARFIGDDVSLKGLFIRHAEEIEHEKEGFYWNLIKILFANLDIHIELERFIAMDEQTRIANEIHDTVIQKLFGVVCSLKVLENKLSNEGNDELKEHIIMLKRSIELAMSELRESIYGRRFKDNRHTFIGTIELYMKEAENLHNTKIELDIDEKSDYMSLAQKIAVYRVACEAVNNAIRHGNATMVHVMLKLFPKEIVLQVEDNGIGFINKQEGLYEGNGLKNMRNIADLLRGRLVVDTQRKTGMKIELFLPR